MTVPNQIPHIEYIADGVAVIFVYNFLIKASSDLEVYADQTLQTETVQYTVTGVNNSGGGNVTFLVAPTDGTIIAIRRVMPYDQLLNLQPNAALPAVSLEDRLDRIVMTVSQLVEEISRRPRLQIGTKGLLRDLEWPQPVALQLLQWNATADGLTLIDSALSTATVDTTSQLVNVQDVVEITPDAADIQHPASSFVPAGVILRGIVSSVKTTLGDGNSLTTFSIGTLDEPDRWGSGLARTSGTVSNSGQWLSHREDPLASALDVYVSADAGSFDGTGVIVLTYSAWKITPQTDA